MGDTSGLLPVIVGPLYSLFGDIDTRIALVNCVCNLYLCCTKMVDWFSTADWFTTFI